MKILAVLLISGQLKGVGSHKNTRYQRHLCNKTYLYDNSRDFRISSLFAIEMYEQPFSFRAIPITYSFLTQGLLKK